MAYNIHHQLEMILQKQASLSWYINSLQGV